MNASAINSSGPDDPPVRGSAVAATVVGVVVEPAAATVVDVLPSVDTVGLVEVVLDAPSTVVEVLDAPSTVLDVVEVLVVVVGFTVVDVVDVLVVVVGFTVVDVVDVEVLVVDVEVLVVDVEVLVDVLVDVLVVDVDVLVDVLVVVVVTLGNMNVKGTWSAVLDATRTWQLSQSGRPLTGLMLPFPENDRSFDAQQLNSPCGLAPLNMCTPKFTSPAVKVSCSVGPVDVMAAVCVPRSQSVVRLQFGSWKLSPSQVSRRTFAFAAKFVATIVNGWGLPSVSAVVWNGDAGDTMDPTAYAAPAITPRAAAPRTRRRINLRIPSRTVISPRRCGGTSSETLDCGGASVRTAAHTKASRLRVFKVRSPVVHLGAYSPSRRTARR